MEYGEKLVKVSWVWLYRKRGVLMGFHYRADPVPWVSKNRNYRISKRPKVMNEKRQWYKSDLGRTKRGPYYLPDTWETRTRTNYKHRSWKSNRKYRKQWQK